MASGYSSSSQSRGKKGRIRVYDFILELIEDGQYAEWVNNEGRFAISNWPAVVLKYHELHASERSGLQFDETKAGNKLRSALLNHYADDGAHEYTEAQRINENRKVIERHFQLPKKVFEKLSADDQAPGNGERETSSGANFSEEVVLPRNETASPRDDTAEDVWLNPYCSSGKAEWQEDNLLENSDITLHENMEVECMVNHTEESIVVNRSSNISGTFEGDPGSHVTAAEIESSDHGRGEQMLTDSGAGVTSGDSAAEKGDPGSHVTAAEAEFSDHGRELMCTDSGAWVTGGGSDVISDSTAETVPVQGQSVTTVDAIYPDEDVVQGGKNFVITLKKACHQRIRSGTIFFGATKVKVNKRTACTLVGKVPPSPNKRPERVPVFVYADDGNDQRFLGQTEFSYIDPEKEVIKNLVHQPWGLQSFLSHYMKEHEQHKQSNEYRNGSSAVNEEGFHAGTLPSDQNRITSEVRILRLMVYTAAETDANQFIRVFFSTSVGKAVFIHYRNDTPLPEEVARDNNHPELAEYLEEVHQRLSDEINEDEMVEKIDLQELIDAVQSSWNETGDSDHDSDYMADEEISSSSSDERLSEVDELIEMEGSFRDDSNSGIHSAEEEQMGLGDQKHQQFVAKDEHKFMTNEMNKEEEDFSAQSRDPVQEKEENQRADDEATKCFENLREGSVPMGTLEIRLAPIKKTTLNNSQQLTAPTGVKSTALKAYHIKDITDWEDATNQPYETGGCLKKVLTSTATEEHSKADETQSTTQDTRQGVKAVLTLPKSYQQENAQNDEKEQHADASETQSITQDSGQGDKAMLTLLQSYQGVNAQNDLREQHSEAGETQSTPPDIREQYQRLLTLQTSYQGENPQNDVRRQHLEAGETQSTTPDTRQGDKRVFHSLWTLTERINAITVLNQYLETSKTKSTTPSIRQGDKTVLTFSQIYPRVNAQNDVRKQHTEADETQSTTPDLATKGSVTQQEATPKHVEVSLYKCLVQSRPILDWWGPIFKALISDVQSSAPVPICILKMPCLLRPVLPKSHYLTAATLAYCKDPRTMCGLWNHGLWLESQEQLRKRQEKLTRKHHEEWVRKRQEEPMPFHENWCKHLLTHFHSTLSFSRMVLNHEGTSSRAGDKESIIVLNSTSPLVNTHPTTAVKGEELCGLRGLVSTCPTTAVEGGEPCLCRFGFCGPRGVLTTRPTTAVKGGEPCLCRFGFCGPRGVLTTRPATAVEGERTMTSDRGVYR